MGEGFRERLRSETRSEHEKVDKHPFIEKLKVDETCMKLYIDFNSLILKLLSKRFKIMTDYNDIFEVKSENTVSSFDFESNENFNLLKHFVYIHFMSTGYMFGFGVLYGGSIIRKMISKENTELLNYYEAINLRFPEKLKSFYKTLFEKLDAKDKDSMIECVNNTYPIIYDIFTDLLNFQATSTN